MHSELLCQLLSYGAYLCSSIYPYGRSQSSLPVWHYLRYFSGCKAAFSYGPFLFWKTRCVTIGGMARTQPQLDDNGSIGDSLACGKLSLFPTTQNRVTGIHGVWAYGDYWETKCGREWQPLSCTSSFRYLMHFGVVCTVPAFGAEVPWVVVFITTWKWWLKIVEICI